MACQRDANLTGRVQGRGNIFVHLIVRCKNPESLCFPSSVVQRFPNYAVCPSNDMQTISEFLPQQTAAFSLNGGLVVPQKTCKPFDQTSIGCPERLNERLVTLRVSHLAERWKHRRSSRARH